MSSPCICWSRLLEYCKAKVCSSKSSLAEVPAASLELPGGSRAAKNSSQTPQAAPVQLLPLTTPSSPSPALHPEPSLGSFALLLQEGREAAHCWLAELQRLLQKSWMFTAPSVHSPQAFLLTPHLGLQTQVIFSPSKCLQGAAL